MLTSRLEKYGKVGLGDEGILRTHGRTAKAREVIQAAINYGITYFDSARVYADSEVYYGTVWRELPEMRSAIFQASKSASRDRAGKIASDAGVRTLCQAIGVLSRNHIS